MNQQEFLIEFQKWRAQYGYPKRTECREIFKKYRDTNWDEYIKPEKYPRWIDYILNQDKPALYLDSLFKKGNSVCDSDPKPEKVQENKKTDEDYKLEIINASPIIPTIVPTK